MLHTEIPMHLIYYRDHKRTRCVVERGIGQWKRRFHVLHGEIRVKSPAYVCRIIEACALLHNICKDRNIGLPAEDGSIDSVDQDPPPAAPARVPPADRRGGLRYRDEYVSLYFK